MTNRYANQILRSREELLKLTPESGRSEEAAEGGCGVLGFAANVPIRGHHVLTASAQMHNRGNGKGGGIAMVGLDPAQARVDRETLSSHYLLQIALLDPDARQEVESEFIHPFFDVAQGYEIDRSDDWREIPGLEVPPPDVWRYFVRVKPSVLEQFAEQKDLGSLEPRTLEDEFVHQNTYRLNIRFYASLGEQRAFVLSHGRNLSVLKIVGYAEQVVEYYQLEEQYAHVWIAHQRYPTKGRVWHPGGAHPFIGLNEALVHNGDFANHHAVSEYLRQRNIGQLFLTDTEVSVQLFDLWDRVYGYPLEITLEAMAPTTEHDFATLPPEKQEIYKAVQRVHMHGSPDGPWFFILARSLPEQGIFELLGITDTSMLRPQVFALYENKDAGVLGESKSTVEIGLIASERQAINACLRSLAGEDERFQNLADKYWVARGGSYTDGGAFRFTLNFDPMSAEGALEDGLQLSCANKYGESAKLAPDRQHIIRSQINPNNTSKPFRDVWEAHTYRAFDDGGVATLWEWFIPKVVDLSWDELAWTLEWLRKFALNGLPEWYFTLEMLNRMRDRHYATGNKKRSSLLSLVDEGIRSLFSDVPHQLAWGNRQELDPPPGEGTPFVLDAADFPPEGDESAARWLVKAYELGWRHLIAYNWRGGRFAGSGLGADSDPVRLELYGDVGDYAGSGLDGAELHLHGDGQDQMGQIFKRGKLVVHGDVGQTFMYGAKGGEVFVRGSAAGRPLINAVGHPRVVINGTCLDYLAESFMAGDPLNGGGFVILNGVDYNDDGQLVDLESPYPGGNLFSLASGGAIYMRDPHHKVDDEQLNGGRFAELMERDWELIEPYLQENERLFDIRLAQLLTVDEKPRSPGEVYRKIEVAETGVLRESENR